jgi:hypothetical protein
MQQLVYVYIRLGQVLDRLIMPRLSYETGRTGPDRSVVVVFFQSFFNRGDGTARGSMSLLALCLYHRRRRGHCVDEKEKTVAQLGATVSGRRNCHVLDHPVWVPLRRLDRRPDDEVVSINIPWPEMEQYGRNCGGKSAEGDPLSP